MAIRVGIVRSSCDRLETYSILQPGENLTFLDFSTERARTISVLCDPSEWYRGRGKIYELTVSPDTEHPVKASSEELFVDENLVAVLGVLEVFQRNLISKQHEDYVLVAAHVPWAEPVV